MSTAADCQLWVDTDMGFDDMHALLCLRHAGIVPVAQSLVFGCSPLPQVCKNAQAFDAAFDWQLPLPASPRTSPRAQPHASEDGATSPSTQVTVQNNSHPAMRTPVWHCGAEHSLYGDTRTAEQVLGPNGLLSRGLMLPEAPPLPPSQPAVCALVEWLASAPENACILALGPLTNIAELCQQAPELIHRIQRLIWMGGSIGRGNQTPFAEFNAWADAAAASIVMQSGIPIRMVELEVCRQVELFTEDLQSLQTLQSSRGRLLHDLLGGYLDIGLSRGRSSMALYDPVAAAVVISPEEFEFLPACIQVETGTGEREGQTVLLDKPQQKYFHEVVTLPNPAAVKARIMDALTAAARG